MESKHKIFIITAYYLYVIAIVLIFSYIVFELNRSGWWFLVCILLTLNSPKIKDKKPKKTKTK